MRHLIVLGLMAAVAVLTTPTAWSAPGGVVGPPGEFVFPKFATLYSAPLVNTALLDVASAVACSVLNVGPHPVTVSVNICDATGTCTVPGFGCLNQTLQPGQVCDTSNVAIGTDQALYCKVDASSFGQIHLRGSFQLMNGGDASAATELR
jgi:hypothetical protein